MMGAGRSFVFPPRNPEADDVSISALLELVAKLVGARWIELELTPYGGGTTSRFAIGQRSRGGTSRSLELAGGFSAKVTVGTDAELEEDFARVLATNLDQILERNRLRAENEVLRGAGDATSSALFFFSNEGDILYANPSADELMGLQTEDTMLVEHGSYAGKPLLAAICALVESSGDEVGKQPTLASIIKVKNGKEFAVELVRIPCSGCGLAGAVMVILRAMVPEQETRIEAFATQHGLSPREREVALLVIQGLTTAAMAETLGISPHTVRDHLKHLYRKTGSGSRGELLGMLSSMSRRGVEAPTRMS
jgi:DNA-binding CsgD family transcriptional regulator